MQRRLEEVQANHKKHFSEQVNKDDYNLATMPKKPTRFVLPNDDANKSGMWQSAMRDAAYYFDNPTLKQEVSMKKTLQNKYDTLFPDNWRPPMQSRGDLVSWVCHQQNSFLKEQEAPEDKMWACENPKALIEKFGPNYDIVKAKLGYIKGLHRE